MARGGDPEDALHGLFRPFYATGTGHIFTLSAPKGHMRDGLAAAQIARCFALPQYRNILIEPGRPSIKPAENIIIVGWSKLFVEPHKERDSGRGLLTARLRERVDRIQNQCCFELRRGGQPALVNGVTGKAYVPEERTKQGTELDYGVIRRLIHGPMACTVIMEGLHRLGTLGTAKMITDPALLALIWEARRQLGPVKDSFPLEILVEAVFHPDLSDGVYAFEAIDATPLCVVFNRHWIFDLAHEQESEWRDQRPWNVNLVVKGHRAPVPVPDRDFRPPVPRLELRLDLGDLDQRSRQLCRALLVETGGVRPARSAGVRTDQRRATKLLELLAAESDRLPLSLLESPPRGAGAVKEKPLPEGMTFIRRERKRFIVILILCRLLGIAFRNDNKSVQRFFPDFARDLGNRDLPQQLRNRIRGKIGEGFEPLFGETKLKPKSYIQIDHDRKDRTYELRLDQITLVVRIRF
jgi:hypothetical protein